MRFRIKVYRLCRNKIKGPMFTIFFMLVFVYTLSIVHSLVDRGNISQIQLPLKAEEITEHNKLKTLLDIGNTRPEDLRRQINDKETEEKYETEIQSDDSYYDQVSVEIKPLVTSNQEQNNTQINGCKTHVMFLAESQIGNLMAKYSVLYGLWMKFGAQVYLFPKQYRFVKKIFENLSIPNVPDHLKRANWRPVDYSDLIYMLPCDKTKHEEEFFIITDWPKDNGIRVYREYLDDLRKEFKFHQNIVQQVNSTIDRLQANRSSSGFDNSTEARPKTVVGIHVRRGDHRLHTWLLHSRRLPGASYISLAVEYLSRMLKPVQFIIASDDRRYVQRSLVPEVRRHLVADSELIVLPQNFTQQQDMAALSLCSHVITTVGTFGMFSGILSGGSILSPARYPGQYSDPFDVQINPPNDVKELFVWN